MTVYNVAVGLIQPELRQNGTCHLGIVHMPVIGILGLRMGFRILHEAVSYTHLDVYKRQHHDSVQVQMWIVQK